MNAPTSAQVGAEVTQLLQECGVSYVSVEIMRRQLQRTHNLTHEAAVAAMHAAIEAGTVRLTDRFMLTSGERA